VTRPSATRPRTGASTFSVTVRTSPAGTSAISRAPSAARLIANRPAAPGTSASEKAILPPANVSPADSGFTSMPARLRNVCSSADATRPVTTNVTTRPSDSA